VTAIFILRLTDSAILRIDGLISAKLPALCGPCSGLDTDAIFESCGGIGGSPMLRADAGLEIILHAADQWEGFSWSRYPSESGEH